MVCDDRVLIIAEAGVNHNGDILTAKKMIESAAECGADVVKFQTFNVDSLVSKGSRMAEYQKKNMHADHSQKDMLSKLALTQEDFLILSEYAKEIGITFLSTPFDMESIRFLSPLQRYWKIPSGEITNYPYLVEIAKTGKKVILSTGMATLEEIEGAWKVLREGGCGEITLMHCTTEYPAPYETVGLRAMQTLHQKFDCRVGYSDHTMGIEVAIAAVAMGACVIEKHFTLDRNMTGPDHVASLEPDDLARMVKAIRHIQVALGTGEKAVSKTEMKNRIAARKSIVAAKAIRKGERFTEDNLTTKRPGDGLSPMLWTHVLGMAADRDYLEDDLLEPSIAHKIKKG